MPILVALLPDILLILLGCAARRRLSPEGWKAVDALSFHILFPALIFWAAARAPVTGADLAVIGAGTWLIMAAGLGLAWLIRPLGPERFLDFAGLWQTAWRFNTAIALVAAQVFPDPMRGYMAMAIGAAVPVANILAVAALSRGNALGPGRMLRQILTNPFFLASLGGLAVSVSGITIPGAVGEMLGKLAAAAVPVALLSIGAAMNWRALAAMTPFSMLLNAIKLVLLPALCLGLGRLAGMDDARLAALVLFAALPTASAAHVLASVFGADRERVATLIAQSTLLACATLPAWMILLERGVLAPR
ncbi:MAG: transporter [Rhodovulum sulfidophilum]|uniref:Transporter n=1 Tax=Rhodovulum sulfidophilum TaxID=35806 RepID=A0A2W5PTR1_RHOSU|nr:MAG: transporter [Rhodovulum sulfidophilum]